VHYSFRGMDKPPGSFYFGLRHPIDNDTIGRSKFKGYVTARRSKDEAVHKMTDHVANLIEPYVVPDSEKREVQAGRAAESLAGIPYLKGNDVELLIDGDATFKSLLDGIDQAQKYILFQFYIVHDDEIGREVKDHLVAKAREGIRVYFLYDEVGSHDLPDAYKNELKAAGIEVYDFHTRKGPRNRFQINFRNHRKILVVDGHTTWIGGHNVGDEYLGRDPKFGHWRDTHVKIVGPAALGAQLSFVEDWFWATEDVLDLDWTPRPAPSGADIHVLTLPTGPADELESAMLMFVHAINTAKQLLALEERAWTGLDTIFLDRAKLAAILNLDYEGGLLVQHVARGSPAERAGLRGGTIPARIGERELLLGGDLILEIGSQEACHSECLVRARTHIQGQSRISVKFLRGGVVMEVVIDVSATRRSFLS